MGELVRLLGQGLVVVGPRRVGIEREVELVLPAELEARLGQRVVARGVAPRGPARPDAPTRGRMGTWCAWC